MDQPNDDPQGEPLACVAIAAGLRRARLATVHRQPDDQPRDRRTTRVIGVEHLGEEHAEGHERRVDALLERDACGGQRGVDHLGVEDFVKRQNVRFVERFDLFGNPPSCSLGHGRPPCRDRNWIVQSPILVPRRPTFVYPKFQKQLTDFRVPFVSGTESMAPAAGSRGVASLRCAL